MPEASAAAAAYGALLVGRELKVPAGSMGIAWAQREFGHLTQDPLHHMLDVTVLEFDPTANPSKRFRVKFHCDGDEYWKKEDYVLEYLVGEAPERPNRAGEFNVPDEPRARPRAANARVTDSQVQIVSSAVLDDEVAVDPREAFEGDDPEEAEDDGVDDTQPLLGRYKIEWPSATAGVEVDPRTQDKEGPKMQWGAFKKHNVPKSDQILATSYLKYFLAFWPAPILEWWCRNITTAGRAKYGARFITGGRAFTPGLFLVFLGCFLYMMLHPGHARGYYWNEKGSFPDVAHNLKQYGLTLHDFEHILEFLDPPQYQHTARDTNIFLELCKAPPGLPSPDPFKHIRRFLDTWNAWTVETFSPSYLLNADESMIRWLGKFGSPGYMFVRRKPDPLGHELKNLACAICKVMFWFELQEGKMCMANKKYVAEYGATAAFVLRAMERFRGTGKALIADSWFGSVKTAVLLLEWGLYCILVVKTNHKFFCLDKLKSALTALGDITAHTTRAVSYTTKVTLQSCSEKLIYSVLHKGPSTAILPLVCTFGTTSPGKPMTYDSHKKMNTGECEVTIKNCAQPHVAEIYHEYYGIIDAINRQRTGGGPALRDVWKTKWWVHADVRDVTGISVVNAQNSWQYFEPEAQVLKNVNGPKYDFHRHYLKGLLVDMFNNPWLTEEDQIHPTNPVEESSHDSGAHATTAVTPALGLAAPPTFEAGSIPPFPALPEITPLTRNADAMGTLADVAAAGTQVCVLVSSAAGVARNCSIPGCKEKAYSRCETCDGVEGRHAFVCGTKSGRDCFSKHALYAREKGHAHTPKRYKRAPVVEKAETTRVQLQAARLQVEEAERALRGLRSGR